VVTRRQFVCSATLAAVAACSGAEIAEQTEGKHPTEFPFTLGVASGDPTADGVVLWTRLAPEFPDGQGLSAPVTVYWRIGNDPEFKNPVQSGVVTALPDNAHCVHIGVENLQPGTVYYYQFETSGFMSAIGRTKTLPAPGSPVEQFTIALTSCMEYSLGYFSALRDLETQQPDIVIHNGDYVYEAPSGTVRPYPVLPEARSLQDYRKLYAQYRQDPALREAHARFPWIVLWDDHEIVNDSGPHHFLPSSRNGPMTDSEYQQRRRDATKAFLEHMPLRAALAAQSGTAPVFYSRRVVGDLLDMSCLDVRSYRDTPVCNTGKSMGFVDCPDAHDPARSMLGTTQEQWLFDNFGTAACRWNCLVQATVMAPFDRKAGPQVDFETDGWDNYAANRDRITDHIRSNAIPNCIALGGNIHAYYAGVVNEVMTEIVTTSISAAGGGSERYEDVNNRPEENPGMAFFDNRYRGYTLLKFSHDQIAVSLRTVDNIATENGNIATLASMYVNDGKLGVTLV